MKMSALVLLVVLAAGAARAQEKGFGAGILLGEPTGVSLKGWLSPTTAVDAGIGWSFRNDGGFHLHADYLFHNFDVFHTTERLPLYYGIGGRLETASHTDAHLGIRMVVGVDMLFRSAPFDIFFEIAPVLDLAPTTEGTVNAGIGGRFWFH